MKKNTIKPAKRNLFSNVKGGTDLLETLILVAFIAIVAIGGVSLFGDSIRGKFVDGAGEVEDSFPTLGGGDEAGDGTTDGTTN